MENLLKYLPNRSDLSFLELDLDIHLHVYEKLLTELSQKPYNLSTDEVVSDSLSIPNLDKWSMITLNLKNDLYLKFKIKKGSWTGQGFDSNTVYSGFILEASCALREEVIKIYDLQDMLSEDILHNPYIQKEYKFCTLFDLPIIGILPMTIGTFIECNQNV